MEELSAQVSTLQSQIESFQSLLPHLHSTLLSLPSVSAALTRSTFQTPTITRARATFSKQLAHNTEITYRLTSGITAFRVRDPDPYAVDSGKVLGLRIELPQGSSFGTPYFVFLVAVRVAGLEGDPDRRLLKVHRHTVPVAVPVDALARRYLALPGKTGKQVRKQNLHAFARALRHAIASYHARLSAVDKLREDAGLVEEGKQGEEQDRIINGKGGIVAVTADDAAHTVNIEFKSGVVARIRMNRAGMIEKVGVRDELHTSGEDTKRRRIELKRRIESGDGRIEGVVTRILGKGRG